MGSRTVLVVGVPLDAEFVADALAAARDARLLDDRRTLAGHRAAFRTASVDEAIRRLRASDPRASVQLPPERSTPDDWIGCHEFGALIGRSGSTVRRAAAAGRFAPGDTRRVAGRWLVKRTAEPPTDGRKHR